MPPLAWPLKTCPSSTSCNALRISPLRTTYAGAGHHNIQCDHVGTTSSSVSAHLLPHMHPAARTVAAAGFDNRVSRSLSRQVRLRTALQISSASLTMPPRGMSPASKNTVAVSDADILPNKIRSAPPTQSPTEQRPLSSGIVHVEKNDAVLTGKGSVAIHSQRASSSEVGLLVCRRAHVRRLPAQHDHLTLLHELLESVQKRTSIVTELVSSMPPSKFQPRPDR